MPSLTVANIAMDQTDSAGVPVRIVYAKDPPNYAVYGTDDRVVIQFADDPATARSQRSALTKLNPLRGEINGLVDGWRSSKDAKLKAKARCFDRRAADALTLGLEGDVDSALGGLQEVAKALIEDRTSWARFLYLLVASGTAALLIALIGAATSDWFARNVAKLPSETSSLWLAAAAGAVGAFFSIAVAIRSRTVLTDLHMRDNVADSLLRILIGVIAATLLLCLLLSKVAHLSIGGAELAPTQGAYPWTPAPGAVAAPVGAVAVAKPQHPAGAAADAVMGAAPMVGGTATPDCLCDLKLGANELTPDHALPAAEGGVAFAAAASAG
jgi:hypothetical protein